MKYAEKIQRLLNGEMGTPEGRRFAKWLQSVDRLDVLVEFYDWCACNEDKHPRYLKQWMEEHKPELMTWHSAQKRVTE